ncbi:Zinc finger HIT domain-containing protein 2, partial [Coemansia furcata]
KHEGCTESFYKEQVEEDMRARRADDATKLEMQRMVQRYNDYSVDTPGELDGSSDTDKEEEAELAERLNGVDLEDEAASAAIWSRLTEAEREEFLRLIDDNEVGALLEPWVPWWSTENGPNVVEADENDNSQMERKIRTRRGSVPKILQIGTPVQQLAKKVHPSVLFQITQAW